MANSFKEIGEILRNQRLKANRDLDEIAQETKITARYLEAIESGEIGGLPSQVYYKLFVRAYAGELGIDPGQLLEKLEIDRIIPETENRQKTQSQRPEKTKADSSPKKDTSLITVGIVVAAVVALVFVVIILVFYNGVDSVSDNNATTTSNGAPLISEPDSASNDSIISATEEKKPIAPAEAQPMELKVYARELCWTLIEADGDTVLAQDLPEGSSRTYRAQFRFRLSLGNPAGIEVALNDTLLENLSPSGRPIRDLEINRLNKAEFYKSAGDSTIEGN